MSEIPGVLLKDVWNTMTASQHIKCIQSIARHVQELCKIQIPYYGSIYHHIMGYEDGLHINHRFVIGPFCGTRECSKESTHINTSDERTSSFGPCKCEG